jgi:hypothetical protein
MSQIEVAEKTITANKEIANSAYVPPLQRTAGQPPPIAAHGGLSYMAFERDGDAGTAVAIEDACVEISSGEEQRLIDTLDNAPPGPIKTRWGLGFRDYDECLDHIRANGIEAPQGGLALPLRYTIYERSTYSVVSSNAIWRRSFAAAGNSPSGGRNFTSHKCCAMRGASASIIRAFLPTAPNAWTGSASRWLTWNPNARISTIRQRWSACSTRKSRHCFWRFSPARPMLWSITTTFLTRTIPATAPRTRMPKTLA